MKNSKRKLYFIGAGEFAREIESWISLDHKFLQEFEIAGFLDNNQLALKNYPSDYEVVGDDADFQFEPEDAALICIANPAIKKRIAEKLEKKVDLITYVSPLAIVAKFVSIGKGSIICPGCVVSTNVNIKEYTTINCGSLIGHDCVIGEYTSLMANVDVGGHVNIGSFVFMGTKSTVIPQMSVANNISIGAGSVVVRKLRKEGTYFGNPALLLKY